MPTPEELLLLQQTIDSVVDTSEELQKSNALLIENISYVAVHNVSPEAHPDIRALVGTGNVTTISAPTMSGPLTVETSEENIFTFSAHSFLVGVKVTKFKIIMPDLSERILTTGVVDDTVSTPMTFIGSRFEKQHITVYAYDEYDNASYPSIIEFTITANAAPDLSGLICTGIPAYANPNDIVQFTFSGATDIDIPYGDSLTYSIENTDLVFTKTSGIAYNETLQFTVPAGAERGTTKSFNLRATDTKGGTATKTFSLKVNQLPDISFIDTTLDRLINKGSTVSFRISGATDPDGHALTYSIISTDPHLSFSKTANIGEMESIDLTVDNTAVLGSTVSFTIVTIDEYNASVNHVCNTSRVNTPPNVTGLTSSLDSVVKPGGHYTFHLNGGLDVDDPSVKYNLTCSDLSFTFSKVTNISDNEDITLDIPVGALRGASFSITVTAIDSIGATTSRVFNYSVNRLIDISLAAFNIPTYVKPSGSYTAKITGVDDNDGQLVKYDISANTSNVTFSKTTNISIGEDITVNVLGGITRGGTVIFTCDFTDGIETVSKTFTTKVNRLPSTTVVDTLPTIVKPNSTVGFTLNSTDVDNQVLSYSLVSDNAKITFSKYSGIAAGESVNIIAASDATRGDVVTLTITISDGIESVTTTRSVKVNTLPSVTVTHDIPSMVVPNTSDTIHLSSTDVDGQTVTYGLSSSDPGITFSKSTGIAVNESITMFIASGITRGTSPIITITVSDGLETVTKLVPITVNALPNMTGVVIHDLPSIVKPNTTYPINIDGAIDANGQNITYAISSNNGKITFSKASNLEDAESFNLITDPTITRGATVTLTVTATNGLESSTKTFDVLVNTLPDMSAVTLSLPTIVKPNTTYTGMTLNGITDASAQALTYSISCNDGLVTFSKYTGLASGEAFNIVLGNVTRGGTLVFTITGNDGLENSAPIVKNITVNTLPVTTGITCNIPAIIKPTGVYNFALAGATDTNGGQALSYSISSSDPKLTFSKSTGIAANESVSITAAADVTRGSTATLTVTVSDGLETVTKTFTTKINTLPSTSIVHNIPNMVIPGGAYTIAITDTDADSQALLYSISSNNVGITFSKTSGIANGESFTMNVSGSITRDVDATLTVVVSDGIETISTAIITHTNALPVSTGIALNNLPTIVKPNSTTALNLTGGLDTNAGQTLTYAIASSDPNVTFSKSSGLASAESFNMVVASGTTRNSVIALTVTVSDGLESTTKEFTVTINSLPVMTGVAFSLPATVKPNTTYTGMTLNGITDPQAQSLSYSISSDNVGITFSKSTGLTSGEAFNVIVGAVARNTTVTFTVTGSDGLETVTKTFTTKINNLPVATAIAINSLPVIVKPNSTQAINITGGTDVDAQALTYSISSSDPKVTFSKASGLTSGESFNMVVDSTITRGTVVTLTVVVSDGLETASKNTFTTTVNTLPVMTGVAFNLPAIIKPSFTNTGITLSGATDANGQALSYSIVCDNVGITFSKSTGLASGETFSVIAGAIARGTTLTFTITVSDGLETNTITKTAKINTLPSTTVTTALPAILYPGQTQAMSLTSTDADAQAVSYSIASSDPNVTFSKATGLASGESFNVILAAGTTRGSTITLTITISDGLETSSTTKTFKVNTLPVLTALATTLPTITKPNSTVAFTMSGATDVDSQGLTYAITSSYNKVTFSKATGIASGESVNIVTAADAVRGTSVTLTISVTDGLETVTTTKTLKINTLPATTLTETLPATVVPGQTYATTLSSTDADSQTLSYSIVSSDPTNITFSKSTGLAANESFNIIVGAGVTRGATITFTVTISDGLETSVATFTTLVNSLPTGGIFGVPAYIAPGSTTAISFDGVTDPQGGAITYSIVDNDANLSFSKTSGIAAGESINMIATAGITRGSTPDVTVIASDGLESIPSGLGVKINTLPVMTGVAFSLPAIVKPSFTYSAMTLSGATDVDGQGLTYGISSDNVGITFSKSTGLASGEAFNVIVGAVARNTTVTFTITVSDGVETNTITKTTKINNLPVTTGFADTLPTIIKPDSTNAFTMSGVTDADGQGLTYSIVCDKAYITFSKSSGIAANESINAIVSAAAVRGETATFTVTISDGLETVTKTFTTKINTLPPTSITETLPVVVKPNSTNAFSMTVVDADAQTVSMSIVSSDANVTFSKATGIASGESINAVVSSSITRNTTVTFTVTISDGLETSTATFTTIINVLPVATAIVVNNLPAIVKPTGVYALNLTGGTTGGDSGQVVYYAIESNDANVTFSKASSLASGEAFNMTVGGSIVRNTTVTLTVTISDGLELATKTFTFLVNSLPVVTGLNFIGCEDGTRVLPGKAYTSSQVNGFTDVNSGSQSLTYTISCDNVNVTFSKSTGLILGELFTTTIGASIPRGTTLTFTIVVSDGLETASTTRTRIVNSLPTAAAAVCNNLPTTAVGSSTPISVNFTGATDADAQAITYSISGITAGLTFSKTSGITAGEAINLTIAKVSVAAVKSFTVTVNDGSENGTVTKTFSITVNPIYLIATPNVISPTAGQVMTSDAFTFTFDAINVTVDLS